MINKISPGLFPVMVLAVIIHAAVFAQNVKSIYGLSDKPIATASADKNDKWLTDIDYAVDQIIKTHPNPFRRIAKDNFYKSVTRLKEEINDLTDDEIALRLMQIVAGLRDGHTSLSPAPDVEADWFPVRFYQFSDGLFITAIDKQYANFAGAKVLRIGDVTAEEALSRAQTAFASDNQFAALQAAAVLSFSQVIRGLKISGRENQLTLQLESRDKQIVNVELAAVRAKSDFDYLFYGEMFGPVELMTAFNKRSSSDYFDPDANAELPLHLRARHAYWFTYLPKEKLLYFQLNAMAAQSSHTKESLRELLQRMFLFADLHPIELFVLDLRYNSGGNGALVDEIVHEFIKRDDTLNRAGHLFTIVGRKTYSAGGDLAMMMKRHTRTAFVGEPMGVGINGSGDPDTAVLPNSRMRLSISTNYYIGGKSKDQSWEVPVQFPAQFSSTQYFSGQDPALDLILNSSERVDMLDVLQTDGGTAALKLYEMRKQKYEQLNWWQPFEKDKLNAKGYQMLEQNRKDDAIKAFQIVADRFPDSWESWDSLAEGYMSAGKYNEAVVAYKKALEINPNNWNAGVEKKSIRKMEDELRKKKQQ